MPSFFALQPKSRLAPNTWKQLVDGVISIRPLYHAITTKNYKEIELLLEAGALPDSVYQWIGNGGYTKSAMMIAATCTDLKMVMFLREHGLDINYPGEVQLMDAWSPMAGAARCGLTEIVKYLIDEGADTNCAIIASRFMSQTKMLTFIQDATLAKIRRRQAARVIKSYMSQNSVIRLHTRNMIRSRMLQLVCDQFDGCVQTHVADELDRLHQATI